MPVVLGESVYTPPVPQFPPRKRWTREECETFEQAGLWAGQHFELIEGELINKTGKHLPHTLALKRVVEILRQVFGWDAVLQETSIDVAREDHSTSEPEPDAIVLKRSPAEIRGVEPEASDVALAVEIADTTLNFDRTTKAALYARAMIAEYWVLDLKGRRLIVHGNPSGGVYKSVVAYSEQERFTPLGAPGRELAVADLL
jgi:Uma2 family endonuclease